MTKPLRLLLVEDSEDDAELVLRELRKGGVAVDYVRVETAADMTAALADPTWDLVISDYSLPQFRGTSALALLQETGRDIPFILVSGTIGEDVAVEAMKAGAHDYIMKDKLTRLAPAIERELREADVRRARRRAEEERQKAEASLRDYSARLQVLSRRLMEAQESERRHIARELHDEIGQELTAIKINMQALLRQPDAAPFAARLQENIDIVDRTLQQVRNLSLDLRPSMLDDLGLVAALRWYVDRQGQRAGLAAHFSAEGVASRLPPEVETGCFRIVQEAVTNVLRHARAKRVEVELRQAGTALTLGIVDDGDGFEPDAARARARRGGSLGLLGMQERAEFLNGTLTLESRPRQGTRIQVVLPVPASQHEINVDEES